MAKLKTAPSPVEHFNWPAGSDIYGDVPLNSFQEEFDIQAIDWDLAVWWNADLATAAYELSETLIGHDKPPLPSHLQTVIVAGGTAFETLMTAIRARVPRSESRCVDHIEQAVNHILRSNGDVRGNPFMLYDSSTGVWRNEKEWITGQMGSSVSSVIDRAITRFDHAMARAVSLLDYLTDAVAPMPAKLGNNASADDKKNYNDALEKRKLYMAKINEAREMSKSISRGKYAVLRRELRSRLVTEQTFWDSDTRWLVLNDGVLDLDDVIKHGRCEVIDFSPYYASTMALDVGWHDEVRNAGKSEWERGIEKVLPDPGVRSYLQRRFGAALIGQPGIAGKSMVWQFGAGDTAKSTIQECVAGAKGVFAPYSYASSAEALTKEGNRKGEGERFKAYTRGKRFAIMSELNSGDMLDAAMLKQITGGDTVQGTAKYTNSVSYFFTATLFMASNHPPALPPGDTALVGRIHVVPFTHRLWDQSKNPDEWEAAGSENRADPHWAENVLNSAQERSAILRWVIAGLIDFGEAGGLGELPESMKEAREEFAAEADPIGRIVRSLLGEEVGYELNPWLKIYSDGEWETAGFLERDGLQMDRLEVLLNARAVELGVIPAWESLNRRQLLAAKRMLDELGATKKKVLLESRRSAYAFTRCRDMTSHISH